MVSYAGWTEKYTHTSTNLITGKSESFSSPFSELVTAHTIRRSFATNMFFHRKSDKRLVMNFTHHKTEEVFDNYIKFKKLQYVEEFIEKFIMIINQVEA